MCAVNACRITMNLNDLAGKEDPPKRSRRGRTATPRVVAGLGDTKKAAGVTHVVSLPGQGCDHRVEPFGGKPCSRKTSLTLRETVSSVSS